MSPNQLFDSFSLTVNDKVSFLSTRRRKISSNTALIALKLQELSNSAAILVRNEKVLMDELNCTKDILKKILGKHKHRFWMGFKWV
jgi:hypothetical protein